MANKLKDKGFVPALILTLICFGAALALAFTNAITEKPRADVAKKNLLESQQVLFPEATEFKPFEMQQKLNPEDFQTKEASYIGANQAIAPDGKLLGFLIQTDAKGYGGKLPIMVAVTAEGKIKGVGILPNQETPGLGQKVAETAYITQYRDKDAKSTFTARKATADNVVKVDAVSGATISSDAVARATSLACEAFNKFQGGK